jgi:hypothetical protein
MTDQSNIIEAKIIDGIEMYCSLDGIKTGMTVRGLVRFTGIARTTLQRLLLAIEGLAPMEAGRNHMEIPQSLSSLNPSNLYHYDISPNGGPRLDRILTSFACAKITNWAATEHNGGTEIAKYSASKFIENGFTNFIKEATGYRDSSLDTQAILASLSILTQSMEGLKSEMAEVKTELATTNGYRVLRADYPGLKEMTESLNDGGDQKQLTPFDDKSLYTIDEAIKELYPRLTIGNSEKISLGMMVAGTYKTMKRELPPKVRRLNDKGQKLAICCAYPAEFLPVIRGAFIELIATTGR